LQVQPVVWV